MAPNDAHDTPGASARSGADASDLDHLLNLALTASLEAGRKLLQIYRSDYAVSEKADQSPVTAGDMASHGAIVDLLQNDASAIPILSEEQAEIAYETRRNWRRLWLVDPLDGTKEFLKENGEFTTNIALIEAGEPILGVVYAPAVGTIYWGSRDIGAFRATVHAEASDGDAPRRLREHGRVLPLMAASAGIDAEARADARPSPDAGRAFTIAASRSHLNEATEQYIDTLTQTYGPPAMITAGSAVKLCLVAEGTADVYPRLGTTMEWDTAAGDAVVRAAGAEVVAYESGEPLQYNKADLRNPWFVVKRL
jgi:3'(2'), 5'-bisphosphate nucleotidase